ncbi:MAG: hypothetical protein M1131_06640 [Actinobacteria bacterium]|jgi:hypothetical protein|nr:hypothetical protein [Actinomycetota bacterium]MCL6094270.1 hypothetical protein [Actinomycetota bacterium]
MGEQRIERIEQIRDDLERLADELAGIAIELLEEAISRSSRTSARSRLHDSDDAIDESEKIISASGEEQDNEEEQGRLPSFEQTPSMMERKTSFMMRGRAIAPGKDPMVLFEKKVTRARHAVEKAVSILSDLSDSLQPNGFAE